ncbi:hypothetical protein [Coleofasciculus sp.]|uniref:hypothetical protein n=1 Tax=Coleofasciculus sp. TaxID=3100458 RepID=UPI0039FB4FC3
MHWLNVHHPGGHNLLRLASGTVRQTHYHFTLDDLSMSTGRVLSNPVASICAFTLHAPDIKLG